MKSNQNSFTGLIAEMDVSPETTYRGTPIKNTAYYEYDIRGRTFGISCHAIVDLLTGVTLVRATNFKFPSLKRVLYEIDNFINALTLGKVVSQYDTIKYNKLLQLINNHFKVVDEKFGSYRYLTFHWKDKNLKITPFYIRNYFTNQIVHKFNPRDYPDDIISFKLILINLKTN